MPFSKRAHALRFPGTRAKLAAAVIWGDRLLRYCARRGVPAALGFVIVSGPILSHIGGGLAPYPGMRSLHVLAGLGLALAVLYQAGVWGSETFRRIWRRLRHSGRGRSGHVDRAGMTLFAIHGILFVAMLWSGFERYAGRRWGRALLPLLSVTEWSLLHRLLAPYYVAALLVYWFLRSRIAWRTLLDQLRRP
jgi:hypothetical protein